MANASGLNNGHTHMQEAFTSSTDHGLQRSSNSKLSKINPFDQVEQDSDDKKKLNEASTHTIPFHKLFSVADFTDYVLMIAGTVGAIGNGLGMPILTILFGQLTDSFGHSQDNDKVLQEVSKVLLKFFYLAIGSGMAAFLQVACWMVTGERQAARIRNLYLKTILRQDVCFFDMEVSTGEVVGRMSGDTVLIQDALGEKVGKFIQLQSTFLGGYIIAFSKGWLLTLVMISTIPPLAISGAFLSIVVARMASQGHRACEKAANIVDQTIGSIRTVASFTGEKKAVTSYNKSLVPAYKADVKEGLAFGFGLGLAHFMLFSGYAMATWFGAKMIIEDGYTGGDVLNIIFAVLTGSVCVHARVAITVFKCLGQTSPCMSAFAAGRAAAFKMFETINRKPVIDSGDKSGKVLGDICGDIELRDVYFSYPARPVDQILSGFSLLIPSGITAALVGESGSGKSTIISLIDRFYDPQAGEILIDGINLKEFQLNWIRKKIGLVSQEPVLFASSIRDNIAYGKDDATIEEIRLASELANAATFINKLPQGLDTMVGEHGTQLSGGQKQRIAIARAILKDPRILLLDEATSALDAESERIVQEALDRFMGNRTTVIVAHRLSTVRNADTIVVIHRGKMVEKGSHHELLMDPEGAYSLLMRMQEVNNVSEQPGADDQEKSEVSFECQEQSSRTPSYQRSVGRGSSGIGNSMHKDKPIELDGRQNRASEKPQRVPFRRLVDLNKPELIVLIVGTIAAMLNGVLLPVFGLTLSNIVTTFYKPPHELREGARYWALVYIVLGAMSLVIYSARSYLFAVAGSKLVRRIREMCFEKVIHMHVGWFDEIEHSSGAIGARLSADAASIRGLVGDFLAQLVQNISTVAAGLVIAFSSSWQLALVVLSIIPLVAVSSFAQIKFLHGFSADAKMMYEEASQVANDAVGSIRTVASFCAEEKVMELYSKKCDGPTKTGIRQGLVCGAGFGVAVSMLFSFYALSLYAGARLVHDGKITYNDVFRVIFTLTLTSIAISESSSLAPSSNKAKDAAATVFSILDQKSEIDTNDESGMTLQIVKGDIELSHISFKYPSRPEVQIFQDFTLTIPSGKIVALVGESGSGKSTVISLLQRFYNPDYGYITLDGIEIQKFQLKWLRQQMGLVSQEPSLFNDTIRANIAYGKDGDATEAEIVAASELANAHKFISGLEKGYDTIVGERGVQLSGGQKQRVAIARAIVKSPKILLLDEATSALDAESERVVQDALEMVMVNRTTVVVAHRLSTVKGTDLIAVVKGGVVIEKGNHEALINIQDGSYASLVSLHLTTSSP